ncbi:MAG: cytochrome c biogenesis CcdA family protein [Synergistaceae bacterium]|nr:cytochrome c biogenesis CcdA family protein [Synergistaceae bacterium]
MTADIPFLFLEGLLAFISPCMLPMLPIYLMYLAAETENGRRASIVNTIGFVCGFTLIFMALGATATAIGSLMSAHRFLLQRLSGLVIFIFGLHFLGVFTIDFLDIEKKLDIKVQRRGFFGAILFGSAFSLGWTPCLGPFLGSALMLAGNGKTMFQGIFYLFVFSMGLGIPYVVAAIFFTNIKGVFQWLKKHGKQIKFISGIILVIAGLLIMSDSFGYWASLFD